MPDAGHGSYWGGDDPDYSRETAKIAHEFLGIPDAVMTWTPERALGVRTIADAMTSPQRTIPARETGRIC